MTSAELKAQLSAALPLADRRKLEAYCALHDVAMSRALVMSESTSGDLADDNYRTWARAVSMMQRLGAELTIPPRLRSPFHEEEPLRTARRACAFASLLCGKPGPAAHAEGAA